MSDSQNSSLFWGGKRRHFTIAVDALLAAKLTLLMALAWNTRFVMDEFAQLGWAKYVDNGFFETVWPAKAIGYAVFYKVAHLAGWDAVSILLAGRIQTALLACVTLGLVYGCARALGNSPTRCLIIVLLVLCFSNFMERIFRTIAEPLALFFAVAALLVVLRGSMDRPARLFSAGVLSGLAFLATQKSVYFNLALGTALVADAAMARHFLAGAVRGAWLVAGWLAALIAYCLVFGADDPIPVARSLIFGPIEVATTGADAYANGLRHFVGQTLTRNAILYFFCFAGMGLQLLRIRSLDQRHRVALVFTLIIVILVFTHDQPWPYVFIMVLPFVALWSLTLFDHTPAATPVLRTVLCVLLLVAIAGSYVRDVLYLRHDNADQLRLIAKAESMLAPDEAYFDGIGMLPNRPEPSTLWLDTKYVQRTKAEGRRSEAYWIFTASPPKVILWSYRMDGIYPVVAPLIEHRYVRVAPNLWVAGHAVQAGSAVTFDVPVAGQYALYNREGRLLDQGIRIDGVVRASPFYLPKGVTSLQVESNEAFVLPAGLKPDPINPDAKDLPLFAHVYD